MSNEQQRQAIGFAFAGANLPNQVWNAQTADAQNLSGHECPCCGCVGLAQPAYEQMDAASPGTLQPPYWNALGQASQQPCGSCGYVFGITDDPNEGAGAERFSEHRQRWLEAGGYNPSHDMQLPAGAFTRVDFSPLD